MLQEIENLKTSRPNDKPPAFGRTILATVDRGESCLDVLQRVESAWLSAAKLGRWCDEELGDWPSLDECLRLFPSWFSREIEKEPGFEIDNWLDDIHDRSWIWWSGACVGSTIKIDISADSLPLSLWTIELVILKANGTPVYTGDWMPLAGVSSVIDCGPQKLHPQ